MKDAKKLQMEWHSERSAPSRKACSEPTLIGVARTSGAFNGRGCIEE